MQRAHSVSPLAVLARGYAIVTDAEGEVLRNAGALKTGQPIRARLHQGDVFATITGVTP